MSPASPASTLPAACAECIETTLPALPGANLLANVVRRFRSLDGRLRVDYGAFSMITNPLTGEQILLNHLAQEARILAAAAAIPLAAAELLAGLMKGAPALPNLPPEPNLVALGQMLVEGLVVEGVRHVFAAIDGVLPPISSWEVWTNVALQMPVFTQTIGSFGVRTCVCKCTAIEPPAAAFQIPSGYTVIPAV